jgi:hypothetical protein
MNLLPGSQRIVADGVVGVSGKPTRLYCVSLISGGTASVLSLLNGADASGTQFVSITGTASTGIVVNFAGGLRFPNGLYADVDSNIASATFVIDQEF